MVERDIPLRALVGQNSGGYTSLETGQSRRTLMPSSSRAAGSSRSKAIKRGPSRYTDAPDDTEHLLGDSANDDAQSDEGQEEDEASEHIRLTSGSQRQNRKGKGRNVSFSKFFFVMTGSIYMFRTQPGNRHSPQARTDLA